MLSVPSPPPPPAPSAAGETARPLRRVMVTGGAGFIGSTLVRQLLQRRGTRVLNYDALTYAGLAESVADLAAPPRYEFVHADVTDPLRLAEVVRAFGPDTLLHLAAESHVDRSIAEPAAFLRTNVEGTATVLRVWRDYRDRLTPAEAEGLLLVPVSTDEVYGSLEAGEYAEEGAPYNPSSPYSASKAAADHLVRAYGRTYGLAAAIACPTNNYGPRQFPEKLIPLATLRARRREPIPLYGDGTQVRDWLHVGDCAAGIIAVALRGVAGETYHLSASDPGAGCERNNREVVTAIADVVDELAGAGARPRRELVTRVADRPGHDRRYALDSGRARRELGWAPATDFATGLRETVAWYLENESWVQAAERRA